MYDYRQVGDSVGYAFQEFFLGGIRKVRIDDDEIDGFVSVNLFKDLSRVLGQIHPEPLGHHFPLQEVPDMGVPVRRQYGEFSVWGICVHGYPLSILINAHSGVPLASD